MSPTTRLYVWGCRGSERTHRSRSQSKSSSFMWANPSMNSPLRSLGAPRVDGTSHTHLPCLTAETASTHPVH